MNDHIIFAITVVITFTAYTYLGTLVIATLTKFFGVEVKEIAFGIGPSIWRRRVWGSIVSVCCIPICSYMKATDNRFEESTGNPEKSFDILHPLIRFCISLSSYLPSLLLALFLFPNEIISRSLTAVQQLFMGALSPLNHAQDILEKAFQLSQSEGILIAMAVILLKLTIFNLLPISPLTGLGQAFMSMRSTSPKGIVNIWGVIAGLLLFAFSLSWFIALVMYSFLASS